MNCEELRFLVIQSPMHSMHLPFVRDIFAKIAKLKLDAYQTLDSKYFAFDQSDLIATHFIVGRFDSKASFNPLISFKGTSQKTAQRWGLPFSGWDVVLKTNSKPHMVAIKKFMDSCAEQNIDYGYAASLAMCPSVKDKNERTELVKMFESMIVRFNIDFDIKKSFCIGRVKNDAYKLMSRVGYLPLELDDELLPPIPFPQYINDEFYILVYNEISQEGAKLIEKYKNYWDNKILITEHENNLFHIDNLNLPDEHKPSSLPEQVYL